jgi:uncharacterized membrane protein
MKTSSLVLATALCCMALTAVLLLVTVPFSYISTQPITFSNTVCSKNFYLPLFALTATMILFLVYVLGGVRDSHGLRLELLTSLVLSGFAGLLYYVMNSLFTDKRFAYINSSFVMLWILVSFSWSITYPAIESMRRSHAMSRLHTSPSSFNQVLNDPKQYAAFKTVVADQFCFENILFYEIYVELRTELGFWREREALIAKEALYSQLDYPALKLAPLSLPTPGISPSPTELHPLFFPASNSTSRPTPFTNPDQPHSKKSPSSSAKPHHTKTNPHPLPQFVQDYFSTRIIDIYHTFIAPNSPQELNLPQSLRNSISDHISSDSPLQLSLLRPVFREVYDILYHNSYPQYLMNLSLDQKV